MMAYLWLVAVVTASSVVYLLRCRHTSTYRERRDLAGVRGVMHLVCSRCGRATTAMNRTADEHRLAQAAGSVREPRAREVPRQAKMRAFGGRKCQ